MTDDLSEGVAAFLTNLPQIREDGAAALRRLLVFAQSDHPQSPRAAAFILSFYDRKRFEFEIEELLDFDEQTVSDCIRVMHMQLLPEKPVQDYFDDGAIAFEKLAMQWNLGSRWGQA